MMTTTIVVAAAAAVADPYISTATTPNKNQSPGIVRAISIFSLLEGLCF